MLSGNILNSMFYIFSLVFYFNICYSLFVREQESIRTSRNHIFKCYFGGSPQIQLLQSIWRAGEEGILFLSAEMGDKLRMQEELKDLVEKEFIAFPDILVP